MSLFYFFEEVLQGSDAGNEIPERLHKSAVVQEEKQKLYMTQEIQL